MLFFKSSANLPDGEKARLEFHLQQIAECVGPERLKLPVKSISALRFDDAEQALNSIGKHLKHDVSGVTIQTELKQQQQCGGGG